MMMIPRQISVAIFAGNSGDKLTQRRWSHFLEKLMNMCAEAGEVRFTGGTSATMPFQSFCVAVELCGPAITESLKEKVADLARDFEQDSVAWIQSDSDTVLVKAS